MTPRVERKPFRIDWECFGKHSIKAQECLECEIDENCLNEKEWEKRMRDFDKQTKADLDLVQVQR